MEKLRTKGTFSILTFFMILGCGWIESAKAQLLANFYLNRTKIRAIMRLNNREQ